MTPLTKLALCCVASSVLIGAAAAPVAEGGRKFGPVQLTGSAEVPGPGDPNGSGTAEVFVNVGQKRVCWKLENLQNLDPLVAAHIHEGGPTVAGPIRISFFHFGEPVDLEDCTTGTALHPFDRARLQDIIQNPQNYYVNIHTTVFPAGAIRGQMSKK